MESPKRGGTSVTACPWYSIEERNWVLERLYSSNINDQTEALRHMDIWKARVRPRIPLGLEVTSALAKTMLLQKQCRRMHFSNSSLDDDHFQLMYSTAIIRFVNLVTECGQIMDYSIPIHAIAFKMGIPEWIVELRHSATHSGMPSLELLQTAAKWAFEWLKVKYWELETEISANYLPAKPRRVSLDNNYDHLFATCLQIHKDFLEIKEKKKTQDILNKKSNLVCRVKQLIESTNSDILVTTLLSDGLLFPSAQETIEKLTTGRYKLKPNANKHRMIGWLPILKLLTAKKYMLQLLKELLKLASTNSIKGKYASEWLDYLLSWIKKKQSLYYESQPEFCKFLLNTVTPSTVVYLGPLFEIFGKHMPAATVKQLISLAETVAPKFKSFQLWNTTDETISSTDSTMDTEDLDDSVWEKCPIGVIPSQLKSEILDLRLPSQVITDTPMSVYGFDSSLGENTNQTELLTDNSNFIGLTLL